LADWLDVTVTASAYWVNLTLHEMPINGVKVVAAQVSYIRKIGVGVEWH